MNVCGKALPPKAASLLGANTLLLVVCVPFLLTLHSATQANAPLSVASFAGTLIRLAAIGLVCQMIFYHAELYNLQIARNQRDQAWRVMSATGIVMLLLAITLWAFPKLNPGRDALLGLPIASMVVLLITRRLAITKHATDVMLIGTEPSCRKLQKNIAQYPEWSLHVKAICGAGELALPSMLGSYQRVIVCADANLDQRTLDYLIDAKMRGTRIEKAAQFYEQATGRVELDAVNSEWLAFANGFEVTRGKLILKRLFDLCAASFLLLMTLPLILLAATAIALEGKGPLFYMQDRVGLYGKVFRICKFRTMIPAPAGATAHWTTAGDKRITPLGRILRTFRIDELPQLLNILIGDMSLVGPRPEQPHYCELLAKEIPFYHQRHTVLPGLTGWAQVRYTYGASIGESRRKLEYDLFYIKNLSIWLDLAIAFETFKVVLVGQGAK